MAVLVPAVLLGWSFYQQKLESQRRQAAEEKALAEETAKKLKEEKEAEARRAEELKKQKEAEARRAKVKIDELQDRSNIVDKIVLHSGGLLSFSWSVLRFPTAFPYCSQSVGQRE
eukprot:SAG11_NODE_59_length_19156_cov_11.188750_6_plen_115_part_00